MPIVISVDNLSKSYRLGQIGSGTLARDLNAWWARARGKPNPLRKIGQADHGNRDGETLWALKDVSFQVQQGEVLGVIGRNGAGKSTLLKILSRVTAPTGGQVKVKGRIASLLEVGTGFHPDLTGRENVYLNGAILGMTREEVRRKFDEIVNFAEVEQFIDTPVKRYSSGMYVRLAFAVAAHLEPEILLVDEVLAVGDAEFQKKCLGKMGDVAHEGRTVLFVSHNMSMITRLCDRTILFDHGDIIADGDTDKVTRKYLSLDTNTPAMRTWTEENAPGDQVASLRSVKVVDNSGMIKESISIDEKFSIEIGYYNKTTTLRPTAILHFYNEDGTCLFASNDWNNKEWWNRKRTPGMVQSVCRIPANFLAEGKITVLVAIGTYNPNIVHAIFPEAVAFQIVDHSYGNASRGSYAGGNWPGVIRPYLKWDVQQEGVYDDRMDQ